MNHLKKPRLRNVNVQQITHQGQPVFLIQDGLKLTDTAIVLPRALGPFALLCDGTHTLPEMQTTLEVQYGLRLSQEMIADLLVQFDEALLLESEYFNQVKQQAIDEYRAKPFRQPAMAGPLYPADADSLRKMLQSHLNNAAPAASLPASSRGVISPHIDYQRGGLTYAHVWASAAEAVRQAELVIILGTDHNGGYGTLTLTPQNYASPLGAMPTDGDVVNKLAQVLGPENAFAEELHHVGEHSIELVLVWLQYMRREKPCPVVPILVGSFYHYMTGQASIEDEKRYKQFVDILRTEMEKRRTIIVSSGDLAHLGPAFGESPLNAAAHAQMKTDDDALLENLCQGNADLFFKFMKAGQYQRNVCGLAPFYFTLKTLGQTHGQTLAYDRCPADQNETSFVSVCGLVWE